MGKKNILSLEEVRKKFGLDGKYQRWDSLKTYLDRSKIEYDPVVENRAVVGIRLKPKPKISDPVMGMIMGIILWTGVAVTGLLAAIGLGIIHR